MSSVDRYLRPDQPDKQGRYAIMLAVYWHSNRVRLSSGEKCLPAEWDARRGQVAARVKFSADINQRLAAYDAIKSFIYQRENAGLIVTEAMVRAEIDRIRVEALGKKAPTLVSGEPVVLLPTVGEFAERHRLEMAAQKSKSWDRIMKTVADHLLAFRPALRWEGLTDSTLNLFKVYLQEELDLSDATLRAYVSLLRGMLQRATKAKLPVPIDYTWLETRRVADAILPELEYSELLRLPTNTNTGWYFAMAARTGLRHSDLWQLQRPKLVRIAGVDCLEALQQKVGRRVPVPLGEEAMALLESRPTRGPLDVSTYNKELKLLGQRAEWNREIVTGTHYKGQLLAESMFLYEAASSHMARRSFAALMNKAGMPTRTLQEIMGHASIASTAKYAKVSSATIVEQAVEAWRIATTPLPAKSRGVKSPNKPHGNPKND